MYYRNLLKTTIKRNKYVHRINVYVSSHITVNPGPVEEANMYWIWAASKETPVGRMRSQWNFIKLHHHKYMTLSTLSINQ